MSRVRETLQQEAGHQLEQQATKQPKKVRQSSHNSSHKRIKRK